MQTRTRRTRAAAASRLDRLAQLPLRLSKLKTEPALHAAIVTEAAPAEIRGGFEVGYQLRAEARGEGYATEAGAAVLARSVGAAPGRTIDQAFATASAASMLASISAIAIRRSPSGEVKMRAGPRLDVLQSLG